MRQAVPARLPALPLFLGQGTGIQVARLVDNLGADLPTTQMIDPAFPGIGAPPQRGVLLVPTQPLVPGTYLVRYDETCMFYAPDAAAAIQMPITVGAEASLPTLAGSITIAQQEVATIMVGAPISCVADIQAATVRVQLTPSPELAPFLPVTRLHAIVDGADWATSWYGETPQDLPPLHSFRAPLQFFAFCARPDAATSYEQGLALGPHHAEIDVHIAGAASDPPPVAVDFTLSCAGLRTKGCDVAPGAAHAIAPSLAIAALTLLLLLRVRRSHSTLHSR
jgi:hypothetical protein